jgi:hypothetical protein
MQENEHQEIFNPRKSMDDKCKTNGFPNLANNRNH